MEQINGKYYTPTIEEFHVGFEYERDYGSGRFKILKYYPTQESLFDISGHIELGWIRVKYLDKEDIESLRFEYYDDYYRFKKSDLFLTKHKNLIDYNDYIELYNDNNHVFIYWQPNCLFDGYINNKSELVKLLKQLGI